MEDLQRLKKHGMERKEGSDEVMKTTTHSVCTHAPNITFPSGGSWSANDAFSEVLCAVTSVVASRERRKREAALTIDVIDVLFLVVLLVTLLLLEEEDVAH